MGLDSLPHCTESIRMARREGSAPDLADDSTTSPVKIAPSAITYPSKRVASTSFARTFVPGGVWPATTGCCMVTGNSCALASRGAGGSDWATRRAGASIARAIIDRKIAKRKSAERTTTTRTTDVRFMRGGTPNYGRSCFRSENSAQPSPRIDSGTIESRHLISENIWLSSS
jgi:hypothetical protein